jgi:hypothetical protein
MRHHNEESGLICIELSQWEGKQLYVFLRDRSERADGQLDRTAFEPMLDRLDEANALAVWLREKVVLNLSTDEAALALQAVEANLDGMVLPPSAAAALQGLQGKLVLRHEALAAAAG